MPKLIAMAPTAALVLLAGCGSPPPPSPMGNLSDDRGAHAGAFKSPTPNATPTADAR